MSRTPELPKGFHDENFQDKARHASDNKECIRLLCLAFIQEGLPEKEVAKLLKVNPRSVFDWLTRYKQGGIDALRDQGGRGRKNTLNDEQEKDFKNTILDLQEKREGGRIVGRDVKEVLKNSFGVKCVNSTVYKLLHKVGLSWISGRTHHPKQDLEAQEAYKKTSKLRYSKGCQIK